MIFCPWRISGLVFSNASTTGTGPAGTRCGVRRCEVTAAVTAPAPEMGLEKTAQVAAGRFLGRAEPQADDVHVGPAAVELGLKAQFSDLAECKSPLRSHQVYVNGVGFLRLHGRPGNVLLGHVDRDDLLVVPKEPALRGDFGQQLEQLFEQPGFPRTVLPRAKPRRAKCQVRPSCFQGCRMSDFARTFSASLPKPSTARSTNSQNSGRLTSL